MKRCVQPLVCPVCEARLTKAGNTLKCPELHSFDIAREGYINLFVSRKRPKILGDTREMLRARRNFLDRGHYSPLCDAINHQIYEYLADDVRGGDESSPTCVVDVGCGDGYYIGRLQSFLDSRFGQSGLCCFGMDISKEAVRLAAGRYKAVRFIVASVRKKMLFPEESVRVVLDIFAPRNVPEFGRIMVQGGIALVVIPNPDHLLDLRPELDLLGIEANKRQRVIEQFSGTFTLVEEQKIDYEMRLTGDELFDLICMTPSYWHIKGKLEGLEILGDVQTNASFSILKFHR